MLLLLLFLRSRYPEAFLSLQLRGFPRTDSVHLEGALRRIGASSAGSPVVRQRLFHEVLTIVGRVRRRTMDAKTRERLAAVIVDESMRAGYDPLFVTALIRFESTFERAAISPKGAVGLMQLLPSTGEYVARLERLPWHGTGKLVEMQYNVRLGISYLKHLEERFGNRWEYILIAYNWGPTNLKKALARGWMIPSSTILYARNILWAHSKWKAELA